MCFSDRGKSVGTCVLTFSDTAKHKAKLTVTVAPPPPIDYVYTLDGGTNTISQVAFNADGSVAQLAAAYALPPSCIDANSIAAAPAQNMLFVTCRSAAGEVLALNLDSTHLITTSAIPPIGESYPASVIVPDSGPSVVYVSSDGGGGGINALSFTPTSLTSLITYTTPVVAGEMAFYTNNGVSTLYVAANDVAQCSPSGGAIEPWRLAGSSGLLTEQTLIPTCGQVGNVAVANGNLFWAGATVWGRRRSLEKNASLAMPATPWSSRRVRHSPRKCHRLPHSKATRCR